MSPRSHGEGSHKAAPLASILAWIYTSYMEDCFRYDNDSLLLDIHAQPGASKSELVRVKNQRLKVKIAAAPEDGRANRELIALFSRLLHCPKGAISVKLGEKSRLKTLELPKIYGEALETLLKGVENAN